MILVLIFLVQGAFAKETVGRPPKLIYPSQKEIIKLNEGDTVSLEFKWEPVPGIKKYELLIEPGNVRDVIENETATVELSAAADYKWKLISILPNGKRGLDLGKWNELTVVGKALGAPVIKKIKSKYIDTLVWSKPKDTERFSFEVLHKQDESWKLVMASDKHIVPYVRIPDNFEGGVYRLRVKADSSVRQSSDWVEAKFTLADGDRSPEGQKASDD